MKMNRFARVFVATVCAAIALFAMATILTGCSESYKVSHNISQEADNFNVMRKITVVNVRSNKVLYELTGRISLQNNATNELEVICETGKNKYKKDFIYLNDWTTYVVEDLDGSSVSKYHYELNILPQMAGGVTVTSKD